MLACSCRTLLPACFLLGSRRLTLQPQSRRSHVPPHVCSISKACIPSYPKGLNIKTVLLLPLTPLNRSADKEQFTARYHNRLSQNIWCYYDKWVDFSHWLGSSGNVVVKALGYKLEGRGFNTRWGEFLNLLNSSGRTNPWGSLSL
jgi:hypothetical protein